jgi:osmoprotectant transport system permease protein
MTFDLAAPGGRLDFWPQVALFVSLACRALGVALLIGLPLGIALTRLPRIAPAAISVLGTLQTIPSLALLGFCISVLHLIGSPVAVIAAVVYSIFPIALNVYTGIIQVDPRLKDASRGLGMSNLQCLRQVELPLAMPVLLAGVRTGAVYAIGLVTISAIVGAGGLGVYITAGMSRGDVPLILLGVVPILAITSLLFVGLSGLAMLTKRRADIGLLVGFVLIAGLGLYGLAEPIVQAIRTPATSMPAVAADSGMAAPSLRETWEQADDFPRQSLIFLSLMARGLGLALLLGIPIGIVLTRIPRLAEPIISLLALVQTVPSLALLGLCVSLSGMAIAGFVMPPLFGPRAAIIATVVYSLFPAVLNTFTGISQVDPRVKDAARGMGMTGRQILLRIELPLALPVIIAGVRTAALFAIAMVSIAAMVGARGLGDYILAGMETENQALILLGVVPILVITFATFWGLGGLAWLSKRTDFGKLVSVLLILGTSAYAVADPFFRVRPDLLIGSKNFTENRLLAEIVKALVEANTGLSVELYPNLGSNFAYKSLEANALDLYPEYTGTLLTAPDALDVRATPPGPPELARLVDRGALSKAEADAFLTGPRDDAAITALVRAGMLRGHRLVLSEPFGLNNTYAVIAADATAEARGLRSIGDLKPDLVVAVPQEFMERPDGWVGLSKAYGLAFAQPPLQLDPNYLYKALAARKVDVVVGLSTDWQLSMPAPKLRVLVDDRRYFPSYFAATLVRKEMLTRHPELTPLLAKLAGRISNAAMSDMIREVVVDKRRPREVAQAFLMREKL